MGMAINLTATDEKEQSAIAQNGNRLDGKKGGASLGRQL